MNRKRQSLERPKINMTPMIDVVFLLLTFFVMTFRIIIPEGDFNIRMSPMGQALPAAIDTDSVQIRLLAHADGALSAIRLNDEFVENFDLLRQRVSTIHAVKPNAKIELCADDHLRYEYSIRAITAVNGEIHEGQIRKICDQIQFVRQQNKAAE
jgi:biopolymer transport protein ExbD